MYLSTVGILVIAVIFFGLLFLLTPWLYRPYLDLLEAREALEDPSASAAGSEAVDRLSQRLSSQWSEARAEVLNEASKQRLETRATAQLAIDDAKSALAAGAVTEEAQLQATVDAASAALSADVDSLADELVTKALGRSV
jgi:F0F1-type ATP synthase membrane subunit b/b'